MDDYPLLKLAHIVGFTCLGGGLLAVFVSELRAYRAAGVHPFAEAAWYTATFYDALVAPGAVLAAVSGLLLAVELDLSLLGEPWLVGMWGAFVFEFIEGNTVTRVQFRRALRRSREALERGELTDRDRAAARSRLAQITHFLDLPLFLVIVYCGAVRPDSWAAVLAAIVLAVAASAAMTALVPKLAGRRLARIDAGGR